MFRLLGAAVLLSMTSAFAEGPAGKGLPMRKQDAVPPIFGPGPLVTDREFDGWLDAQGQVKLPFTVWRTPTRVGAIGVHAQQPAKVLRFSDTALGISLDERLRQLCGDAEPCRVWLSGKRADATVFDVQAVHERVKGDGPHVAYSVRKPDCLLIRTMKALHCARGPQRCAKCKAADATAPVPKLLDLCPWGEFARPTVELVRDGEAQVRVFDVMRSFANVSEAREFATRNGVTFEE
jgi:hypothetical protein